MKGFTPVIVVAPVVLLALAPAAPAAGVIVTDFSNFSESGPLVGSIDQSFTPTGATVAISGSGSGVGYEWFLSDEFPTPGAGDRTSLDVGGTGTAAGNDGFGLSLASTENPTNRNNLTYWFMEPGKSELALESFDGAGAAFTQRVLGLSPLPDTLFIDRTAAGWSFGSITGGVETVHFADVTESGGIQITADGSALGMMSIMDNSGDSWSVTNFTVVPEPGSLALVGVGLLSLASRKRRSH